MVGAAKDRELEQLVFAATESVGAAIYADVVFAGTELGAAPYGVDVELEQEVFDGTAGIVVFSKALEVIFSLTELVGVAKDVAFIRVVLAGTDIVGAGAQGAETSRIQKISRLAEVDMFLVTLIVELANTELVGAGAYWDAGPEEVVFAGTYFGAGP
jgi:hypothetical protein